MRACSTRRRQAASARRARRARSVDWPQLQAAHAAESFEKTVHGAMVTYCNPVDGSKLVTFAPPFGCARAHWYTCSCSPHEEGRRTGLGYRNVAMHLASRSHWQHWRLVAFGETHPTEAAWQAFAFSVV